MPATICLPLVYEKAEVVSAQRLHLRHHSRLRVMIGLACAALALTVVQAVNPALLGQSQPAMPWTLAGPAALFVLLPLLFYLFVPLLAYRRNLAWREAYTLELEHDRLRLTRSGAKKGFELIWPAVGRLLENERVFLLYFGAKGEMVMLPKRIFASPRQLEDFRRLAGAAVRRRR